MTTNGPTCAVAIDLRIRRNDCRRMHARGRDRPRIQQQWRCARTWRGDLPQPAPQPDSSRLTSHRARRRVACVSASCGLSFGFERNVTAPACAADRLAMLSTSVSGSPRSSQPKRTASSPSETGMRLRSRVSGSRPRDERGLRLTWPASPASARGPAPVFGAFACSEAQNGGRDVERRRRVDDAIGDDEIEVLRLRVSAHFLDEGALQTGHLLVAAGIEVVLHFGALLLQVAGAVTQVFLAAGALVGRHGRAVFLQLVLLRFQRSRPGFPLHAGVA